MIANPKRHRSLNKNQIKVLRFLIDFSSGMGYAPSIHEVRGHLGGRHHSTAAAVLCALERKGYVERIPGVARGLRVLRRPDGTPV